MTQPSGSFRDMGYQISPTFWQGPVGSRILWAMHVIYDAISDAEKYAVEAGAPSIAPADALPFAGIDRQIVQGYFETQASFRSRLVQWLDRWAYSGRAIGVLLFAKAWLLPYLPTMYIAQGNGFWWLYVDGVDPMPAGQSTPSVPTTILAPCFNWDGATLWWRSWLIIYSVTGPDQWCTFAPPVGSGPNVGDTGSCVGFSNPPQLFSGIVAAVQQVKRAGQTYGLIISNDATMFTPTSSPPTDAPDGTWGDNYKLVLVGAQWQYQPTRLLGRFIPIAN